MVIQGNVAFSNLTEMEEYNGKTTGKFAVTLTMDSPEAEKLEAQGVRVKTYTPKDEEGNPLEPLLQRKFASKYDVTVLDADGKPFGNREVPRGSLVKVKFRVGPEHPVHGHSVYLQKVKVLEVADFEEGDDDDDDF